MGTEGRNFPFRFRKPLLHLQPPAQGLTEAGPVPALPALPHPAKPPRMKPQALAPQEVVTGGSGEPARLCLSSLSALADLPGQALSTCRAITWDFKSWEIITRCDPSRLWKWIRGDW